jgi:hypothetical protein
MAPLELRAVAGREDRGGVAEDLIGGHVQTLVIDPLDVWWGLRVLADGTDLAALKHVETALTADAKR